MGDFVYVAIGMVKNLFVLFEFNKEFRGSENFFKSAGIRAGFLHRNPGMTPTETFFPLPRPRG